MVTEILLEIAIAIGRMFINPLFYLAILMAVYLGYRRVKREGSFSIPVFYGDGLKQKAC